MRMSTRLLVFLLPVAAVINIGAAVWALLETEATMTSEGGREARAYARALSVVFEYSLGGVSKEQVQQLIDRVSEVPSIYGILMYDSTGTQVFASDPLVAPGAADPARLSEVLSSGRTVMLSREMEDQRVLSVVQPIRDREGRIVGALEVAQPQSALDAQQARVRRRYVATTLVLLAALSLMTLWFVQRTVGRPMRQLVSATRALGRGELGHRIGEALASRELEELAREFDSMAGGLEAARAEVMREAEERVALERRLRESEKLAAIGKLATGLAHDIAAPLNVIAGRAEMSLRRETEPGVRERYLRIIVQQTDRITLIVRNLLSFARRREPRDERLELAGLLDGVTDVLETELLHSHVSVRREEGRPILVRGDRDLLHQALLNLFLNAIQALQYSRADRLIVVRDLTPRNDGALRVIEIADTGPGIAAEHRSRIFDPFFTTKPTGTGLGLALARSMIQEQGGDIALGETPPGGGASFLVTLRAAAPEELRGA